MNKFILAIFLLFVTSALVMPGCGNVTWSDFSKVFSWAEQKAEDHKPGKIDLYKVASAAVEALLFMKEIKARDPSRLNRNNIDIGLGKERQRLEDIRPDIRSPTG